MRQIAIALILLPLPLAAQQFECELLRGAGIGMFGSNARPRARSSMNIAEETHLRRDLPILETGQDSGLPAVQRYAPARRSTAEAM